MNMKKYIKNGKESILCHIRKKLIQITPEEIVRQNFILELINKYKVPKEFIEVEVPLSHYVKGKKGRVDILVTAKSKTEGQIYPVMLIECKSPNIAITDKVIEQAIKYDEVLSTKLMVITNGIESVYVGYNYEKNDYQIVDEIPKYKDLIIDNEIKFVDEVTENIEKLNFQSNHKKNREKLLELGSIGEDTDLKFVPLIANLYNLIYDDKNKVENLPIKTKKFFMDGGIRFTTFGNVSGGSFVGNYRFFLLENRNNDNDIISISIMGKISAKNHPKYGNSKGYTLFNIAIDDFENSHLSLEYSIDRFVEIKNDIYSFWHDGTLTIGNKGRVKNIEVINFIKNKAPYLIIENQIYLGKIDNSIPLNWENKEVKNLIARFIDYAILRDEFRKMKKTGRL